MTIRELSQLYRLKGEILLNQRHLAELEAQRDASSAQIDGMPHGQGPKKSKVEKLAVEIADLKNLIHAKQIRCVRERRKIERYIQKIPDSLTREIFELRFVDGLSWDDVASEITDLQDVDTTSDAVKKRCYRYLDKKL